MNAKKIFTPTEAHFAGAIAAAKGKVAQTVRELFAQRIHPMAIMAALLDGYVEVANAGGASGVLSGLHGMASGQIDLLNHLSVRPQNVPVTGDDLAPTGPASPYTARPETPETGAAG